MITENKLMHKQAQLICCDDKNFHLVKRNEILAPKEKVYVHFYEYPLSKRKHCTFSIRCWAN